MANEQDIAKLVETVNETVATVENYHKDQLAEIKSVGEIATETKAATESAVAELEAKITGVERLVTQRNESEAMNSADGYQLENFNKILSHVKKKSLSEQEYIDYTNTVNKYITLGDKNLTREEMSLIESNRIDGDYLINDALICAVEKKDLTTAKDPNGGYLVVPTVDPNIVQKKFANRGLLGKVGKRITSGQYERIVDWADYADAYMCTEVDGNAGITANEKFAKVRWNNDVVKYGKKFSRSELEDAFVDIQSYVIDKITQGLNRTVAGYIASGTGVNQPRGILTYTNGTTFGTIEQVTSGTSATLKFADIISLLPSKLNDAYLDNASYTMQSKTFFGLLSEVDSTGKLQLSQMINFFGGEGFGYNILGMPVDFDVNMPSVASGALSVAFGNLEEAYLLTQTPTVGIIRNDVTDPDFIQLWIRSRFDGKVQNFDAVKLLKIQ